MSLYFKEKDPTSSVMNDAPEIEDFEFERESGPTYRDVPLSRGLLSLKIGIGGWLIIGTIFVSELFFVALLVASYFPESRDFVNSLLQF